MGREAVCGAADQIIKNIHFRKFTASSWAPEVAANTWCFFFFFFQAITVPQVEKNGKPNPVVKYRYLPVLYVLKPEYKGIYNGLTKRLKTPECRMLQLQQTAFRRHSVKL